MGADVGREELPMRLRQLPELHPGGAIVRATPLSGKRAHRHAHLGAAVSASHSASRSIVWSLPLRQALR
jgi:hypothetical protein